MKNINKILIIIACLSLLTLAVVAVFIRGFTTSKQDIVEPILYPTQDERVKPTLSQKEIEEFKKEEEEINAHVLTDDQIDRYDAFVEKLPISNTDFAIEYSLGLTQFFIQLKNLRADAKVQAFLQTNNVLDIYEQFPELFVATNLPINQAIQQAEEEYARERKESQSQ